MILGIDPGLHGALVLYDPTRNAVIRAHNVPTFQIERNSSKKGCTNIRGVVDLVRDLAANTAHAFLELVGPMPKQGVSSVWAFSRGDTALETAIVAAGVPYTRVSPRKWKKELGTPADKDGALLRAGQLMPGSTQFWTPKRLALTKEDAIGIAEAALIAYYGAKNLP